jgi:hypothetical protein
VLRRDWGDGSFETVHSAGRRKGLKPVPFTLRSTSLYNICYIQSMYKMVEPFGIAAGVICTAAAPTACVDCFEYIITLDKIPNRSAST